MNLELKLLITDFDGTLADTFEANYRSYRAAFEEVGMTLMRDKYRECFGLRFDNFMKAVGIHDEAIKTKIKELKAEYYPQNFDYLKVNQPLLDFIRFFRKNGGKTAIASTAREKNLRNALRHLGAENDFDIILAGESVSKGKPDPEIYSTVLRLANVTPTEALVFEDSEIGCQSAAAASLPYIRILPSSLQITHPSL